MKASETIVISAMLALATGTFALRWAGPALRARIVFPPRARQLLETAAIVLLTALVAITTLTEGHGLADWPRPIGVAVGAILAWRKAPLVVVVLAAAATDALLRLVLP